MNPNTQIILLGVNIDHCATLRQARYRDQPQHHRGMAEPDPVALALAAEHSGADGITVHLREDRRHIQEQDVSRLRECIRTRLNLEMACTPEMIRYALDLRPDSVCLVPENRQEITTEGGLDLIKNKKSVSAVVEAMNAAGITTSCFIDPHPTQIEAAAELKSPYIELHTGAFAHNFNNTKLRDKAFTQLSESADRAHDLGLIVNAGHGINYNNIGHIIRIPWLHELNIGHSIMSRALLMGIEKAVWEMKLRICGIIR